MLIGELFVILSVDPALDGVDPSDLGPLEGDTLGDQFGGICREVLWGAKSSSYHSPTWLIMVELRRIKHSDILGKEALLTGKVTQKAYSTSASPNDANGGVDCLRREGFQEFKR